MSAINEALKKARELTQTAGTGNNGYQLLPGRKPTACSALAFGASLLLGTSLVTAGFFIMRASMAKPPATVAVSSRELPLEGSTAAAPPPIQTAPSETLSVAAPGPEEVHLPPPVAAASPTPSAPAPSGADYPNLRLQGIFFSKGNPKVVINTQTLGLGDTVEGVTVKAITSDTVTLQWRDKIKTLTLR